MKQRDREKDMQALAKAFFENLERSNEEYGGWGVHSKRPFGNSYVEGDILEIIGMEPGADGYTDEQDEYAASLYDGLGEWLSDNSKAWLK